MTHVWEYTDEDGDRAWLDPADAGPYPVLTTTTAGVILAATAARSLRDALNAYLEQTSTAEAWELP